MEPRYQKGKVYKIISPHSDKVYIGSTAVPVLAQRMTKHCQNYKHWKDGKRRYVSSFDIIEAGDAQIILIENFPYDTKDQLLARENHWMQEEKNDIVNRQKAFTGLTASEYQKQYYLEHKNKKIEQSQQNYEKNRVRLCTQHQCECGGYFTVKNKTKHLKTVIYKC
jgi:hypothetical protein